MKKFIIKIFLFSFPLLIVISILNYSLGIFYGNEYYSVKYQYYKENKNNYNSIFFGSSRLYRHLNPSLFDSLMYQDNYSTFNLAAPATNNPEVYFLYDLFLKEYQNNNVKNVFIELQPLKKISEKNINTSRNNYWLNLNDLNYAFKYLNDAPYLPYSNQQKKYYLKSYLSKMFNTSKYTKLLSNNINKKVIGNNGYYSLNQQTKDESENENLKNRLNEFLNDTTVLQERINNSLDSNNSYDIFFNQTHFEKIEKIIKSSKEKGIHVYFVIPPKLPNYKEIYALKEKIPKNNLLDMSNASTYPKLYQTKYTFDVGHLNENGANLFTEYLAEKIIELKSK